MKKILVGFDGSEGSEHAMNRAILLLDQYGELILFAVIPRFLPRCSHEYHPLSLNIKTNPERLVSLLAPCHPSAQLRVAVQRLLLCDIVACDILFWSLNILPYSGIVKAKYQEGFKAQVTSRIDVGK